jgi:hypothetical protein
VLETLTARSTLTDSEIAMVARWQNSVSTSASRRHRILICLIPRGEKETRCLSFLLE